MSNFKFGFFAITIGAVSVFAACSSDSSSSATGPGSGGASSTSNSSSASTSTGGGGSSQGGGAGSGGSADAGPLPFHCDQSSTSCVCILDTNQTWGSGPTGGSCPPDTFTGGPLCCAHDGYPASSTCTCEDYSCSETSFTCICTIGGGHTATRCANAWSICCAQDSGSACACDNDNTMCHEGEHRVASCDLATAQCDTSDTRVDRCAP